MSFSPLSIHLAIWHHPALHHAQHYLLFHVFLLHGLSNGGPAYLKKTERQGHEHLCHTSMPVRNGNLGSDRTTTTQAASVRKQLGPKNSKSNESRQAKNGGVKGRDGSAVELDRETGEEQITVGWTRRKDGR